MLALLNKIHWANVGTLITVVVLALLAWAPLVALGSVILKSAGFFA